MRTLMVAKAIMATHIAATKGGFNFFKNGSLKMIGAAAPLVFGKNDTLDAINVIDAVNGTAKVFSLNPFNFNYSLKEHGTDTADFTTITYPTGNYTLTEPFTGGIVIKEYNDARNSWDTKLIKEFETSSTAWATIQAEIVAVLDTLTGYLTKVSATKYTHTKHNIRVDFVGSLNVLKAVKTFGEVATITGADVRRLEVELSTQRGGGQYNQNDEVLYSDVNFLSELSKNYDLLTIQTQMPSERSLLPESDGFETMLIIAVDAADATGIMASIVDALAQLKEDPSGRIAAIEAA